MARRNAFLDKMQRQQDIHVQRHGWFMRQVCNDAFMITCHRELGVGPTRMPHLTAAYTEAVNWILDLVYNGVQEDRDNVYAHEMVDRAVKEAFGDNLPPYEVRYGLTVTDAGKVEIELNDKQKAYLQKKRGQKFE